ncbi:MAG: 3-demethylubiquinone-9 3-methyltransferase [uncultured Paraburkholderia sp.]|nr:MAG: 3-demethylubiquinone-9 3-methyltransferase [uncultured Paraburkholderia sp.]CAH2936433.1 MAG: 3-demethylubiquinone-9 3-methyltransferase [uncultured Paraburkholderia sp.]
MQKIAPCLWFDGNAEEAARFYTPVFTESRIVTTMLYTEAGPGPKGDVLAITFEIEGQEFMALNGGPQFQFSPAISLMVHCVSWQIVPNGFLELIRDRTPRKPPAR